MAETFYSILGVESDADVDTINAAYREAIKESHPDVSDEADASRTFKRLTTARDVLVDEDERDRYDRLGHGSYVRDHLSSSEWQPVIDPEPTTDDSRSSPEPPGRDRRTGTKRRVHVTETETDSSAWTQSGRNRRTRNRDAQQSTHPTDILRRIGPWLPVHGVLLTSAGVAAWFVAAQFANAGSMGITGAFLGLGVFGTVLAASVLHLVSLAFT